MIYNLDLQFIVDKVIRKNMQNKTSANEWISWDTWFSISGTEDQSISE